jgi:hypothetical protein
MVRLHQCALKASEFLLELNLDYMNKTGFRQPTLVEKPEGLGLTVPPPTFTVTDVGSVRGNRYHKNLIFAGILSETIASSTYWTLRRRMACT